MKKTDIKNLSKDELSKALAGMGQAPYRAGQIFRWLYKSGAKRFEEMTDLPADAREKFKKHFHITKLVLMDSRASLIDGTAKYLFKLEDGNTLESVFLPEGKRATLCLSTQVGCKFGCVFCASAPYGFLRNLKASEILDEVLAIMDLNNASRITNVVFMGIGEPLDNYDNLMKAVRILNDKDAFNIGSRRITISTCGIIPGIERLSKENMQVELSVSLHSARDKTRSALVPVNGKYPLRELIGSCRKYTAKTNRIITFEYVLIKGVNVSRGDAADLARLLKGLKCKLNLISYNLVRAKGYEPPSSAEASAFIDALRDCGMNVTRRKSKGEDIDAGCGQLRISNL